MSVVESSLRVLLAVLALVLAATIGWAVLEMPLREGVAPLVEAELAASGVAHPVTAVLLNFRSLDTLLEVAVLAVAVVALLAFTADVASGSASVLHRGRRPGPLIAWLLPRLAPVVVLVAGYLLWAGAYQSGGAFQGGTVLAAAGVLMLLAGQAQPPPLTLVWRLLLVLGLLVFTALGALFGLTQGAVLQYPPALAAFLIVLIEVLLTFSIAASLLFLVSGVPPSDRAWGGGTEP